MLYHVAHTAGTGRDVWLLVNVLDTNIAKHKDGRVLVLPPNDAGSQRRPGGVFINVDLQSNFSSGNNAAWNTFSSKKGRSKGAKNIMIEWMSAHAHIYDFVWHIERDVLYTGTRWDDMFGQLNHSHADVVAKTKFLPLNTSWTLARPGRCRFRKEKCTVPRPGAKTDLALGYVQTFWPIMRMSTRFALAVKRMLDAGEIGGHHEAVLYVSCFKTSWCVWGGTVPAMNRGVEMLGGWGPLKKAEYTLEDLLSFRHQKTVTSQALYHPVKTGCLSHVKQDDVLPTTIVGENKNH